MPLNSSRIDWPVRFAATSYVVRATVAGGTEDLPFPASGLLTLNRNYWLSGDGQADADGGVGGVGDLITMLATCLTGHTAPATFTGTLGATFRTFLQASTGSFSILWPHANTTFDQAVFGFTDANTPSDISTAGTLLPQGIWRPKRATAVDSRELQPIVGGTARAISGLQRTSALALPRRERELEWRHIVQAQTLQEYELADEPFGSFEEAWLNSIRLGRPFRYYADETLRLSTSYQLYRARELEQPMKRNASYPIFWDIGLKCVVA